MNLEPTTIAAPCMRLFTCLSIASTCDSVRRMLRIVDRGSMSRSPRRESWLYQIGKRGPENTPRRRASHHALRHRDAGLPRFGRRDEHSVDATRPVACVHGGSCTLRVPAGSVRPKDCRCSVIATEANHRGSIVGIVRATRFRPVPTWHVTLAMTGR